MDVADKHAADRRLCEAIERYMVEVGWSHPALTLTDVVVVAMRRGWDGEGGKAVTSVITPTDTTMPTAIGLAQTAVIRFTGPIAKSYAEEDSQ